MATRRLTAAERRRGSLDGLRAVSRYDRGVTDFYDIDRANARLPEVRGVLEQLRSQRLELIALRDRLVAARRHAQAPAEGRTLVDEALGEAAGAEPGSATPDSPRVLDARIRAVIDQMEAAVARLDGWSVQLRDIEQGLADFPALVNGRQVWLCWQLGQDEIHFWHDLGSGFGGRRPLVELS
jgi:hypothetical protein